MLIPVLSQVSRPEGSTEIEFLTCVSLLSVCDNRVNS